VYIPRIRGLYCQDEADPKITFLTLPVKNLPGLCIQRPGVSRLGNYVANTKTKKKMKEQKGEQNPDSPQVLCS
jgi:hypothetical protein